MTIIKEAFLTVLVFVFFKDINGQNNRAGSNLRRFIFKESCIIQLELADLEAHVDDGFVGVVVKNSQEPLHGLYRSWEIKVKAKLHKNLSFYID